MNQQEARLRRVHTLLCDALMELIKKGRKLLKMIKCTGSRRWIGCTKLMWASIIWSLAIVSMVPLAFGQGDITAGCG
jgi:hypothetical protein